MLCEKIKEYIKEFDFEIVHGEKDPDQRDYFVSNEKLKNKGFEAKVQIDTGINELINYFKETKYNRVLTQFQINLDLKFYFFLHH